MIFGGYILRLTFEQAHICAARISRSRPQFVSLDSATFESPVPVGSTLECEGIVVHSSPNLSATKPCSTTPNTETSRIQVRVKASVRDVDTGRKTYTGTFLYRFDIEGQKRMLPTAYEEYMEWINAKRLTPD
jgi:acyl-coenzyme A thioesterase 9